MVLQILLFGDGSRCTFDSLTIYRENLRHCTVCEAHTIQPTQLRLQTVSNKSVSFKTLTASQITTCSLSSALCRISGSCNQHCIICLILSHLYTIPYRTDVLGVEARTYTLHYVRKSGAFGIPPLTNRLLYSSSANITTLKLKTTETIYTSL